MASKKTLNATNLEAMGAERLAELLIEISTANVAVKRRLLWSESEDDFAARLSLLIDE